jgi:hypothetical protein
VLLPHNCPQNVSKQVLTVIGRPQRPSRRPNGSLQTLHDFAVPSVAPPAESGPLVPEVRALRVALGSFRALWVALALRLMQLGAVPACCRAAPRRASPGLHRTSQ